MVSHRKSMHFDLPGGTMLGEKYELLRKLATGGMAEIYLARASGVAGFEKLVVIKRILPTVAEDPAFVQMFLDEARLAATLRHPNIADVYEVGEDDGAPFFAMEFIHGQDLRTIRFAAHGRQEPVPLAIALAIVYGTAAALDYAHDVTGPDGRLLDLVHRDVSASNVLVSYEGAVKLIDFGIARASSRRHETQVGTLKGKIPYMSPEQCRGERLDRRSDLFSLGVVMYELTTGRRPFVGDSDFAIMDQIVHQAPPRPSQLVRGYPPELEAMVMRLIARRPDDRYQSAEALLHELDPYIGQHRLYVSAKSMSKYMRMLFASQLAGMDDPNLDEGTRAQRILATLTGLSQSSQLLTPVSSFPAVQPLSQELGAAAPAGDLLAAPAAVADEPSQPVVLRRRGVGVALALLAVAVLGAGALLGHQIVKSQGEDGGAARAVAAPAGETRPARVETMPVETVPPPAEPRPAEPRPVAAQGDPPPDPAPSGDRADARAGAGADPAAAVADRKPPVAKAKRPPLRSTPPRPPPTRPATAQAPPPTPPTPPPPTPPPPTPPDRAKDPKWDQNDKDSPFLPN